MIFSQYGSIFSVVMFSLLLIPAVIMNLSGKRIKYYGILLNIPMLIFLFGLKSLQMLQFVVFIVCEFILLYGFYYLRKKVKANWLYYIVLALSMVPIIVIKLCVYTPFNMLGFAGISYISFRIWQLVVEMHDEHIEELKFLDTIYFVTFFPTLSSGPIDRYHRFLQDLNKVVPQNDYIENYLMFGLGRIGKGMIYKFGLAFMINQYVMTPLPEEHTIWSTIVYMYAYTLYLFFDFAGYSHFAIGTSYILGIKVGENFNMPFLAHNMKEFWERWHISLSQWFGDYIYKRFVLNTLRNKVFKSRKTASRVGNMVTMLVMGIWHGPYLFYIVYGLYEGAALVVTDIYLKSKTYRKFKQMKCYDFVSRVVCFQVIAFGMLLFSGYLFSF
ncbi:D-alanyl-lipoteichoic acid biosynthesis protein DltB [Mediterraneibacter agrestimuris]|uniref:D-alanyl-lipoteichoic acid biosynthesis protein DltB n=1 Tax=Mediterraneibacter agrestimuris TaxID=2941333 RepID=UPI00203B1704|nr:D-alanyl-lipoteichoic acid biosynthesis protein DltB [Mediterraneibacter agrestimuris]